MAAKPIWSQGVTLEWFRDRARNTMVEHLRIEFVAMDDQSLTASMPVYSGTCQPMRILHGGASVALAETLASIGANATVDCTRFACVGQEINANHIRPVPEGGKVIGTTTPLHMGARSQVWATEIVNERGQRVCVSRMTLAVINHANKVSTDT